MIGFEPPRGLAYAKNRSLKGFFNATPPLDAPDKIILCIMMGFEPPRGLAYAKNRSLKGFFNATPPLDAPPRSNTIYSPQFQKNCISEFAIDCSFFPLRICDTCGNPL